MIDFEASVRKSLNEKLKDLSVTRYAMWFREKAFLALLHGSYLRKQKKIKDK
jgi:hypothetical protein